MKAVLLAGGLGTRMREETEFRPKPMVDIGGKPILWHIMRNLAVYGINEFIIATGYKSEVITQYFAADSGWSSVPEINKNASRFAGVHDGMRWDVTLVFTGDHTSTGGRVKRVSHFLGDETFFVTYGDGLADVNIDSLRSAHSSAGRIATLTAVQPTSRFGLMEIEDGNKVTHFREKPKMKDWVSIGYFLFEPQVLDYLSDDGGLEEEGLTSLATDSQLTAYRHEGFWQPMDTYREYKILEELWESGHAPWKMW